MKKKFLPILFLGLLFLIAYGNAFNNAFISDDIASILQNPAIKDFNYVLINWKYPLRPFLYWLSYQLAGLSPFAFRSINFLFHFGNILLIYKLINILSKNKKVAIFTAAIFAVHPVLVETVSWISGGAYAQSAFFFLLSFLLFIISKNTLMLLASIVSYLFALQAQAVTMTLPAILFLYQLSWRKLNQWKKLIPFFILSIIWLLIAFSHVPERETTLHSVHYMDNQSNSPAIITPLAISSYLELIFWPKDLTLYHSELTMSGLQFLLRIFITIILILAIGFSFIKNRIIFFWLSFFAVSLLPTLYTSINNLTWIVAERYVYLGSLGIFVLFSLALIKLSSLVKVKNFSWILLLVIISLLTVRTILRNIDWKNEDNLWIATGKTSPSSPNTHNNLGDVYGRWGDKQRALQEFQTAIALKPNYGDAYHNLANTYRELGQYDKALENYENALKYNPNLWQSYQNIAALYFQSKQYDLALENIQKAIQINPKNLNLYLNLGVIYLAKGDKEKAREVFTQVLNVDPQNQFANQGLGEASK